jgi:hypothetical protein
MEDCGECQRPLRPGLWQLGARAHLPQLPKVESATAQAVDNCGNNIKRNYALVIDAIQRPGGEVHRYKAVVYVEESIPIKLMSLESIVRRPPLKAN